MSKSLKYYRCILILLLLFTSAINAQDSKESALKTIKSLIENDSLQQAQQLITKTVNQLKSAKKYKELTHYILPLGKISVLQQDLEKVKIHTKELLEFITSNSTDSSVKYLANIEFSKLCLDIGELPLAYDYGMMAKIQAQQSKEVEQFVDSEYFLADYSMKLGRIDLLEKHIRSADSVIKNNTLSKFKRTARVYNLMGALMFFTSKQDSAIYHFENALKHIPSLEQNKENTLYLPGAIKGNMSLIKLNQGKPSEARPLIQSSIELAKEFLETTTNHPLENRVKRNLAIGYTNLNGLYYDLGDFEKSDIISKLAFNYIEENFPKNSQEFFIAAITHAEVKIQQREFEAALKYLDIAKSSLETLPGDSFQLKAFLYNEYADLYYMSGEYDKALNFRERSYLNYNKSNPTAYDSNKLYTTMNLAQAYAKAGRKEEALKTVKHAYDYFYNTNGDKDYFTNALMLTYSRVYYSLGMYNESILWSNKSISLYNENESAENIDKIYFEEDKAEVYLLNAKATYAQAKTKDTLLLKSLLPKINKSIASIEDRKTLITSFDDLSTLIESNTKVFDFAKQVYLQLYESTKDKVYLNRLLSLHESALYNRIRARLNTKPDITFYNIPNKITNKEKQLKTSLKNKDVVLDSLVPITYKWQSFLDSLRTQYPKYYEMRYGTIEEPLDNIEKQLPKNTTAIRYVFIDEELYGFVISSKGKYITKLDSEQIPEYISFLSEYQFDTEKISTALFELYKKLWKPLERNISTEKIIVIPDGELFNLSFESLTTKRITELRDLESYGLLSKYQISYNYSLLLFRQEKNSVVYKNDFIAFAPEFNKKMKDNYSVAITDSILVDKTYLNLIPQPFSVDLAKEYSKIFEGRYFVNENASKQVFKNEANEHKIIHIGTHAESNNVSPELSRLIFAKNSENEDNSLYTFEIYNENLNSNLAILTACETGKPTYQSGEGMISLAHAFNYAGSESILTSLWKIDEKASSQIIEYFYQNIKNGLAKDKALQQAKLTYIENAYGRTLHPHYWAGLVLIGDAAPINLKSDISVFVLVIVVILLLSAILFLYNMRRKSRKKNL